MKEMNPSIWVCVNTTLLPNSNETDKLEYSQSSKSSWPSSKYKDRPARKRKLRGRKHTGKHVINISSLYTTTPLHHKRDSGLAGLQADNY